MINYDDDDDDTLLNSNIITLSGGSLGSWIDEERS